MLKTSDFNYHLPDFLIAQRPESKRDASRLLVLGESLSDEHFYDLPSYFKKGDLLILNNTQVEPVRLRGETEAGGKVELLLTQTLSDRRARAIGKGKIRSPGKRILFSDQNEAVVSDVFENGDLILDFKESLESTVDRTGEMPIPPYIRGGVADEKDRRNYQTVFAKKKGAVAAPTAGLHFTEELLVQLKEIGVEILPLTLHVGIGTFRPVKVETPFDHEMHSEEFLISKDVIERLKQALLEKKRITACGTTVVRTLETLKGLGVLDREERTLSWASGKWGSDPSGEFYRGESRLFVTPGFQFGVVDRLITNFHLPKSTLLMLVSAFAGRERILEAYAHAISKEYRFFSYGDAMLIERSSTGSATL